VNELLFFRAVLCLVIIGGSGFTGWVLGWSIRERPRQLASLQVALSRLETEIGYSMAFLPEALLELARITLPPVNRLFADVAGLLKQGDMSSEAAWKQAVNRARQYLVLTWDDEQILLGLGGSLGISHREDQTRHLLLARERLRQQEVAAETAKRQLARLYNALGWAAGMALVLMLA
jgi:stage III sporulation protein AB